jgi:hypothetical protein
MTTGTNSIQWTGCPEGQHRVVRGGTNTLTNQACRNNN